MTNYDSTNKGALWINDNLDFSGNMNFNGNTFKVKFYELKSGGGLLLFFNGDKIDRELKVYSGREGKSRYQAITKKDGEKTGSLHLFLNDKYIEGGKQPYFRLKFYPVDKTESDETGDRYHAIQEEIAF